ncbi:MAG TPA: biotin--[acetyl-CoA-carboxylase] ligase [Leptospiraceae bacterium]|nr:biotin--[acetyl-CoA-carboxylase] ligase [Leptospiraceae bacterium]HNF26831.1 biotin--[acetyl-CoA-carboxylase] ligase [Leptospiraceae bacterium]HNI99910.1 biotin--[acetyl-CoA-carboxylase] ligase [Leptospiraceae bacterium]HNN05232.1 biotin--[acetyl-CoA-carboxylase] ligase [Leptospiraceae bacterium]HNO23874.1 biotin--[acetyl-CoA-carboxylase] ligase [Leptospiraceae bacterium]
MKKFISHSEHIHLEKADSTNDYIKNPAIPKSAWVTADIQTAGRGRLGRQWESPEGDSIFFSAKTEFPDYSLSLVPLFIGSALHSAFTELYPELKNRLSVKWPNDLYIDRLKCAGILTETLVQAERKELIIGIGINLYLEKTDLPYSGILKIKPSLNEKKNVLSCLIDHINRSLNTLPEKTEEELRHLESVSFFRGKRLSMKKDGKTVFPVFKGFSPEGFLVLDLEGKETVISDSAREIECNAACN